MGKGGFTHLQNKLSKYLLTSIDGSFILLLCPFIAQGAKLYLLSYGGYVLASSSPYKNAEVRHCAFIS
jgi:hypothetical protein